MLFRSQDPRKPLWSFAREILVHCPRCGERASVRAESPAEGGLPPYWEPRRLACLSCGFVDHWAMLWSVDGRYRIPPHFGGPDDPYFGLPLWLVTDCRGHVLWAYNAQHLDLLEAYVSARLRERAAFPGGMTLVERLPAWIKDSKHRSDVLGGILRLRTMTA